jgi:serine/threonine protein kinase
MDQIGEGSYGVVFKCCVRGDPARAPLAVKCVHPRTEAGTKGVVTSMASLRSRVVKSDWLDSVCYRPVLRGREVKLLKELCHHPNIVKLRDVFLSWEEQSMHIVYEYGATAGDVAFASLFRAMLYSLLS